MATMNQVMSGVIGVVGGVIGLVIIADVIDQEAEAFEGIAETVVNYIVPLLALSLIAGAVGLFRFR